MLPPLIVNTFVVVFPFRTRLLVENEAPATLRLPEIPASNLCSVPFVTTSPALPTAASPKVTAILPRPLTVAELCPVTVNVFVEGM